MASTHRQGLVVSSSPEMASVATSALLPSILAIATLRRMLVFGNLWIPTVLVFCVWNPVRNGSLICHGEIDRAGQVNSGWVWEQV